MRLFLIRPIVVLGRTDIHPLLVVSRSNRSQAVEALDLLPAFFTRPFAALIKGISPGLGRTEKRQTGDRHARRRRNDGFDCISRHGQLLLDRALIASEMRLYLSAARSVIIASSLRATIARLEVFASS